MKLIKYFFQTISIYNDDADGTILNQIEEYNFPYDIRYMSPSTHIDNAIEDNFNLKKYSLYFITKGKDDDDYNILRSDGKLTFDKPLYIFNINPTSFGIRNDFNFRFYDNYAKSETTIDLNTHERKSIYKPNERLKEPNKVYLCHVLSALDDSQEIQPLPNLYIDVDGFLYKEIEHRVFVKIEEDNFNVDKYIFKN